MAGVSSLGVGSGLDLESLISKLEAAEQKRLSPLVTQKNQIDAKISAFGKLNSALSAFNKATDKLLDSKLFADAKINVTNESYFTATSTGGAIKGNYTVEISQLATSHSLTSGTITGAKDELLGNGDATRTITIEQANGEKMDITLGQDDTSLEGIVNAINEADGGVSASIVKTSDNTNQIILTSKETGEAQTITAVSSSDAKLNDIIGFDSNNIANSNMQETVKAQDAKFKLNGIDITSASNTIEEAVTGVTITLKGVTPTDEKQHLSVEPTTESYATAIKEWVTAYNTLQSSIKGMTTTPSASASPFASDETPAGPLLGDAVLRNIQQRISGIISHGESGEFATLNQLGITLNESGELEVNDEKLNEALKDKRAGVIDFFVGDGETTGLATKLKAYVDEATSDTGAIKTATNGLNKSLDDLSDRYDQINAGIEANIERYRKQFVQLDLLVNKMNSTSAYLSQQFAAMNGTK